MLPLLFSLVIIHLCKVLLYHMLIYTSRGKSTKTAKDGEKLHHIPIV